MWSGGSAEPAWRGRLGDGNELTIEWGTAGDLLFTDGERARFRLDRDKCSLACAPRRPGLGWQRTLLTKILSSISVMCGYEGLHAGAVDSAWGAVAIAAPTGMGKTTLVLELMQRGWRLLTDDVLVLAPTAEGVIAHPGTPHMNLAASTSEGPMPEEVGPTLGTLAGERWIAAEDTARETRPVRAICLLERRAGLSLDVRLVPPNPMLLVPYMLGLPGDPERERRRFELYADLTASVTLMRVTAELADRAAGIVDLIEHALADSPAALASGAR
jgi:hypothetical protein